MNAYGFATKPEDICPVLRCCLCGCNSYFLSSRITFVASDGISRTVCLDCCRREFPEAKEPVLSAYSDRYQRRASGIRFRDLAPDTY